VGIGAKDQSNHRVAGSLRSFPQDSWNLEFDRKTNGTPVWFVKAND